MNIEVVTALITDLGFPVVVAGVAIGYVLKTSNKREEKMWDTITGFQQVLGKFDDTLKDVALGLRDVKSDVDSVKRDVADLRQKSDK